MDVFSPNANAFRFYDDDAGEAASTPLANQDTNVTINVDGGNVPFQLRYRIQNATAVAGAATDDYALQRNIDGGGHATVTTGTTGIVASASGLTNDNATTNRATNGITDGTGSFVAGEQCTDGTLDNHALTASNFTEHVWGGTVVAADVSDAQVISFRVSLNGGAPGMTNSVTPTITIQKSISGTGALAAQASSAAGTGVSSSSGTGALSAQAAAADGTGQAAWTGTGALAAQAAAAAGAGISASTGSGALAAQAASSAGAGVSSSTGTGALAAQAAAAAGAGVSASSGNGALAAQSASSAGAGVSASTGTGALAAQAASADGTGSVGSASVTGTGALASQAAAVAGVGVSASSGTGALAVGGAALVGVGTVADAVVIVPSGTRPGLALPILRLPLQCLADPIRTKDEWGVATAEIYTPGVAESFDPVDLWGKAGAEILPLECIAGAVNDDEDWGDFRGARQPPRHEMLMALLDRRAA